MKGIAVGCWWFSTKAPESESELNKFSPQDFVNTIKDALEDIENVSNVRLSGASDSFSTISFGISDNHNYFPILSSTRISFDLFLPKRLQNTYLIFGESKCPSENFRFDIVYDHYMPVVYASFDLPTVSMDVQPSDVLVFAREFLIDKLKSHPHIRLEVLGPSPLHANILGLEKIEPESEVKEITTYSASGGRGYSLIAINAHVDKAGESIEELIIDHHETISAYYNLIRMNLSQMDIWGTIYETVMNILEKKSDKLGIFDKFVFNFKLPRLLDGVLESIMEYNMDSVRIESFISESNRDNYFREDGPFYHLVERELQRKSVAAIQEIKDIITILEERRHQYFTNVSTLLAAFAGGIIGSLTTVALGILD